MGINDLRLFILILEIFIIITTYTPIVLYSRKHRGFIANLFVTGILWFLTGFIWGMTLISILSAFVK